MALTATLGDWSAGPGPLPRKLAEALRRAIVTGDLGPGTRLPPERKLARALTVSRSTVVAALTQLREEGLVVSRHGSGTRVAVDARRRMPAPDRSAVLRRNVVTAASVEGSSGAIELLGAHVPALPSLDVAAFAASMQDLRPLLGGSGYLPLGLPVLRERVAQLYTARGLPTEADQVLITNGAQQGLALCAALFVRPGDGVLVETPTYLTAIDLLRGAGADLRGVPAGAQGIDVDQWTEHVERGAVSVSYLVPTHHNPVGSVLGPGGRSRIAAVARAHGVTLIEDEALADLGFDGSPPPAPIARWCEGVEVLTLGSTSKVAWGGLRVGWVRGSAETIVRLGRLKAVADIGSSLPSQAVAVHLLENWTAVCEERRRLVAASYAAMSGLLAELLPSWTYDAPRGGLCVWARLPIGRGAELAQVARRHGVAIVPGDLCSVDGLATADRVRLPLTLGPDVLGAGIRRLAEAWAAYAPVAERNGPALDVLV